MVIKISIESLSMYQCRYVIVNVLTCQRGNATVCQDVNMTMCQNQRDIQSRQRVKTFVI